MLDSLSRVSTHLGALGALALMSIPVGVAQAGEQGVSMAYEQPSNQWFEGPSTRITISPDGQMALFTLSSGE